MDLMLFDHSHQKMVLIANADTDDLDESYPAACGSLERMGSLLHNGNPAKNIPGQLTTLFNLEAYTQINVHL